jgi:5-formyltetrahydrofolate cyclo-ligase
MSAEAIAAEKAALRKLMHARRATLTSEVRVVASVALCQRLVGWIESRRFPRASVIAGYWPIRDEVDPRPALDALRERGYRLALPASLTRGEPLVFRAWVPGDQLAPDAMRIEAPLPSAPTVTPVLLLVPLLGFDRACRRLGYGAGFYDRTLRALRRAGAITAIGLAFGVQEIERVPDGPGDAPLDAVATEDGVVVARHSIHPSPR